MSLTLAEARARAAQLSDVSYDVDLDLPTRPRPTFGCRTTVRFRSTARRDVPRARGGPRAEPSWSTATAADPAYDGARIHLDRPRRRRRQRGRRRRPAPLRHRRRRHAPDRRPRRRRDLRRAPTWAWTSRRRSSPASTRTTSRRRSRCRVAADPAWTVLANGAPLDGAAAATAAGGSPRRRRSRRPCSSSPPARGTRSAGSTPGCRSAGTPGASLAAELDRDFDELRAGHRGLLRPLRRALRRALRRSTPTTRCSCPASTGAPRRCRAA